MRDRLFRNVTVLISAQPVKDAHGDDGIEPRSNMASSCDVRLLKLGLTGAEFLSSDFIFARVICP